MKNKFFFRFEINPRIGTGHAIRCLRIANFLVKKKFDIYIITSKSSFKKLKDLQIKKLKIILISKTKNLQKDAKLTIKSVMNHSSNENVCIFKDNYSLNVNWDRTVRKKFKKLIIIDDFLNKKHDCSIYINFNPYKKKDIKFKNKKTKYLVGLKYFPYDQEIKKKPNKNLCLIFFGGSDKFKYTLKITKIVKNYEILSMKFLILLGKFNKDKSKIKNLVGNDNRFKIINTFQDMSRIYKKVSHIIASGGTTLWEIILNNIYPIIIPSHKNHHLPCKFLSKNDKILLINNLKNTNEFFKYLKQNKKKIKNDNIIDNYGLKRIMKAINEI